MHCCLVMLGQLKGREPGCENVHVCLSVLLIVTVFVGFRVPVCMCLCSCVSVDLSSVHLLMPHLCLSLLNMSMTSWVLYSCVCACVYLHVCSLLCASLSPRLCAHSEWLYAFLSQHLTMCVDLHASLASVHLLFLRCHSLGS